MGTNLRTLAAAGVFFCTRRRQPITHTFDFVVRGLVAGRLAVAAFGTREPSFGQALSRIRPIPEPFRVDVDRRSDHPIELD